MSCDTHPSNDCVWARHFLSTESESNRGKIYMSFETTEWFTGDNYFTGLLSIEINFYVAARHSVCCAYIYIYSRLANAKRF